ncbi:MAG TPA: GFA family protein [Rhodanobacteraceae bacterium]|nr:GFA family protein [Rhodanobacteraceae bacterium]
MTHRAVCLCGNITINANPVRRNFTACHCTMCRRWGGLWMAVECANVSFDGGAGLTIYRSSDLADRGFCANCGTHLFFHSRRNGQYYLPVGLFDDIDDFVLKRQIFFDTKPYYFCLSDESEVFTEADLIRKHGGS